MKTLYSAWLDRNEGKYEIQHQRVHDVSACAAEVLSALAGLFLLACCAEKQVTALDFASTSQAAELINTLISLSGYNITCSATYIPVSACSPSLNPKPSLTGRLSWL